MEENELNITITPEDVLWKYTYEGEEKEYFEEELAIAYLLAKEDIMIGGFLKPIEPENNNVYSINVICNDIFAWARADAEPLPHNELRNLFDMVIKDPKWGSSKWCILQRKEMPQYPVLDDMKKDNSWDLDESLLQENSYEKFLKERNLKKSIDNNSNLIYSK